MNNDIPQHVAIIQMVIAVGPENGLPRLRGHEVGGDRMFEVVEHLMKLGVRLCNRLGFLHRNWKRKEDEVFSLFQIA